MSAAIITVTGVTFSCSCGFQDFGGYDSILSHAWTHGDDATVHHKGNVLPLAALRQMKAVLS